MIYTIGHKETYEKALSTGDKIFKIGKNDSYEGGYAFGSRSEAESYIEKIGESGNYSVFGLCCGIQNTTQNKWYRNLINDAEIVAL